MAVHKVFMDGALDHVISESTPTPQNSAPPTPIITPARPPTYILSKVFSTNQDAQKMYCLEQGQGSLFPFSLAFVSLCEHLSRPANDQLDIIGVFIFIFSFLLQQAYMHVLNTEIAQMFPNAKQVFFARDQWLPCQTNQC